jgi:hypothetical protein
VSGRSRAGERGRAWTLARASRTGRVVRSSSKRSELGSLSGYARTLLHKAAYASPSERTSASGSSSPTSPETMPDEPSEAHQFVLIREIAIKLFGKEVSLGRQMIHIPEGRMIEIDRTAETAVVVPMEGTTGSIRVFPPGAPTPFDRGTRTEVSR